MAAIPCYYCLLGVLLMAILSRDEQNGLKTGKESRNGKGRSRKEVKTAHKARPGKGAAPNKVYRGKSDCPPKGFGGTVGVTGIGENGGTGNSQGGDMSQCV